MSYDDNVKDQVSGSKGLIERAMMYIPFYGGYRKKNTRRDVDREVRNNVVKVLKGVKMDLGNVHRVVVESGDMNLSRDVERLRNKVDTQSSKIEKAVNGYSGVWATIKKKDEELDAIVEWDVKLLENADSLRKMSESMRDAFDNGDISKNTVNKMENEVDDLLELFMQRDVVLKGMADKED